MKDSLYEFKLPEELIAQTPARPRDHAKLLVYNLMNGQIKNDHFYNLEKYLPADTVLTMNNSRVENCRWLFKDGGIEIFVLEKMDSQVVRAMVRPGRKFKLGKNLELTNWLSAETLAIDKDGLRTIKLSCSHDDSRLKPYEHIPLPPYIKQDDTLADEYQTVYAKPEGSLAAPTAGLHFTPELLERISNRHRIVEITLHVGLGTFASLTEENILTKRLHEESYIINPDEAEILNTASHITAVGTTTVRTLESALRTSEKFKAESGKTDIFIQPGFKFKAVNALITNFHLPSTSLLMLVAAFIADKRGLDEQAAASELMRLYDHAVKERYRFYSFGDAMLLV